MRIIDKQHDYYDYLQSPTDTLVFDRRGSFLLTREMFFNRLEVGHCYREKPRYVLMQCGATFWLFKVKIDPKQDDYELKLLHHWKNYNKPRVLISIVLINNFYFFFSEGRLDKDLYTRIDNDDYHVQRIISHNTKYIDNKGKYIREEQDLPILKACGVSDLVSPVDIFTAIEEHLSLLKTEAERIEPLGATNDDKIVMHGFDIKTSFRK